PYVNAVCGLPPVIEAKEIVGQPGLMIEGDDEVDSFIIKATDIMEGADEVSCEVTVVFDEEQPPSRDTWRASRIRAVGRDTVSLDFGGQGIPDAVIATT